MSTDDYNEIELLEASLDGNTTAFEAIVLNYQSFICALTFCAVGDLNQSEELAQETFISAWRNLTQLQDLGKFRSWLCTIAKNAIRSMRRRQQRDLLSQAGPIDYAEGTGVLDSEPAQAVASQEQISIVRDAIGKMPANYRIPLVLFYREQRSIKQVAAELHLSEGVVRQRLSRGRKLLKGQVASMVEDVLSHSAPTKVFTTAVMASITGLAVKSSGVAAATALGAASGAGTSTLLSGLAVKAGAVAAALVISIGAVAVYRNSRSQAPAADPTPAVSTLSEQQDQSTDEILLPGGPSGDAQALAQITAPQVKSAPDAEAPTEVAPSSPDPAGERPIARGTAKARSRAFEFKPRGVLSGLITDADTDEPVVGANIRISKSGTGLLRTSTDDNGFYYLDELEQAGAHRIELSSQEYSWVHNWNEIPSMELKQGVQAVKHFALKRGCQIDVEVVDEEGKPVEKAWLSVSWMGQEYGHEVGRGRSVYTDKQGRALLGAYKPSDISYLVTAVHKDFAPGKHLAKLTDPHSLALGRIVLRKGVSVEGLVQYVDGVPVEGLEITATPDWWNVNRVMPLSPIKTGGYFRLQRVVPGLYDISIHRKRPGGGGSSKSVMQAQLPLEDGFLEVKLRDLSPGSLVSVSGSLRFVGGSPPRRSISVSAFSAVSGFKQGIVTGNEFHIDSLKPGVHRLTFVGDNIKKKVIERVTVPGPELAVALQCVAEAEKPRLRGIVLDAATDRPVRTFKARIMMLRGLQGNQRIPSERWHEISNAQGQFDLEVEGPGIYTVQIAGAGGAWTWSDEINTDEANAVVIKAQPGGRIAGRIVNAAGEPVSGAKVIPLSRACGNRSYQTHLFTSEHGAVESVDGRFSLENMAEGFETLKVVHPEYSFAVVENIEVVNGQTSADVNVTLSSGGVLEGHVYDVEGNAQAGVRLYVEDMCGSRTHAEIGRLASALTDANGFYRVEHLPAQPCRVKRSEYYRCEGVVSRTVIPKDNETTQLNFGGEGVISGQLLIDGKPLVRNRMLLGDPYDSRCLDLVAYVMTDAEGRFTFLGAPNERVGIYYQLPQSRRVSSPDWAKLAVLHKTEALLDLGTLRVESGEIAVSVNIGEWNEAFEGLDLSLQAGTDAWGASVGTVIKPEKPGQAYRITQVPSGVYTLVAKRPDYVQFRQRIQFNATRAVMEVSLDIPSCTASISGTVTSNPMEATQLCSDDHKVTAYLISSPDGSYRLDHLPAGEYSIGGHYTINTAPAAQFSLLEKESKIVDIDTSAWSFVNKGALHTQVVDSEGEPITEVKLWLQRGEQRILPYKETTEGQFFVAEPGDYTLNIECPGHDTISKAVHFQGKDLMAGGSRRGTMIVELGSAVVGGQ
jgi:RNA polymerase sigma factor (sigma-70 family)